MNVVEYSKKTRNSRITVIVPNPNLDMKGDLSKVPVDTRKILLTPHKNGVKRRQVEIDGYTPSGKRVLVEIANKGYFESDRDINIGEGVGENL